MLDRFNSLSTQKFQIDGENVITQFMEHYTANFAKGFASSKLAGAALAGSTAVLSEIELPIAAISALIGEGIDYFTSVTASDDYKAGDVCLFQNGYWPVTPEEEASLAMNQIDDSFEPLAMVPRFDMVIVQDQLADGRYEVFDLAKQETKKVAAKFLRHETDKAISKYPIVQKLQEKFSDYVKPLFIPSKKFSVGDYVFLRGLEGTDDCDGKIDHITSEFLNIETVDNKYIKIMRKDWVKLLSPADLETLKTDHPVHLRKNQIMLYKETTKLRPCIIIQVKPEVLIRLFHLRYSIGVNPKELVKPTHSFTRKLLQSKEYRKIIEMVIKTPFDFSDRIPIITHDFSMNAFIDVRAPAKEILTKTSAVTAEVEGEEIVEIIPASIETRQYSGVPPLNQQTAGFDPLSGKSFPGRERPMYTQHRMIQNPTPSTFDRQFETQGVGYGPSGSFETPRRYDSTTGTYRVGPRGMPPLEEGFYGGALTTLDGAYQHEDGNNTVMLVGVALVIGLGIFIMNK